MNNNMGHLPNTQRYLAYVIIVSPQVPIGLGFGFGTAFGLGFGLRGLDLGLGLDN